MEASYRSSLFAVAELKRSLIVERVKAGLRNAKGKRLGRPETILDGKRISALRAQGFGWKRIATDLGLVLERFIDSPELKNTASSRVGDA